LSHLPRVLFSQDGCFGVGEIFVAAVVAAIVDEFLGGGKVGSGGIPRILGFAEEEAGSVKVNVGHVQPHGTAPGDFPGFVLAAFPALTIWPSGTAVRIEPVGDQPPNPWGTLKDFDGISNDLPVDLSDNLDHYVHGCLPCPEAH
jgi:hypothetical protein